jgi:ElaB/YqjD/DUF883 family membrane-anchored ribosome-binding protein
VINRIATVEAPGNGRRKSMPRAASFGIERSSGQKIDQQLRQFIGDHPALSLALGLTVGIVIGCLIKRR